MRKVKTAAILAIFVFLVFLGWDGCHNYIKRGNGVDYVYEEELTGRRYRTVEGADAKTFRELKGNSYGKDRRQAYFQGVPVPGADAASFESLGDFYARDKYRGYYENTPVKTAVGRNFRVIATYYTTDGRDVFYKTNPLHVASVKNFRFVYPSGEEDWDRWTTDGVSYFNQDRRTPSNDYRHLVLYPNSGGIAQNSRWAYYRDHKLNYDEQGRKVIDTIDIASFRVLYGDRCRDKYGVFEADLGRLAAGNPTK